MLANRFIKVITSLQLTVVLLAFGILLVFIGTIAQVDEGLYNAQARYFHQWLVLSPNLFGKKLPVIIPGGYLIGMLLLLNLVAAHIYRFQFTKKKIGIQLAHLGVILLLVGQLMTDMMARESQEFLIEGQVRSYSESGQFYELAVTSPESGDRDLVVAIPSDLLARGGTVTNQNLPFAVRTKQFWKNSEPSFRAPMMQNGPPLATNGIALSFDFNRRAEAKAMDDKNVPTALIELVGPGGSLGDWVVSGWAGDQAMLEAWGRTSGAPMVSTLLERMRAVQSIVVGGRNFTFVMRPERIYHPFTMKLLKATHTVYPGTDIPKDFRSRVQISNPQTQENREVEIYMNNPLRYAGLTFYQYQMGAGDEVRAAGQPATSTLQVVRNPSWITPYLGCCLVGAGLVIQFMYHLVGFISKRSAR